MKSVNIWTLLLFAIVLNPIIIGGIDLVCYVFLYGGCIAYILVHADYLYKNYLSRINTDTSISLYWIAFALFFCFIIPMLHGSNDYSYLSVVFAVCRRIIIITFLFLLVSHRHKKEQIIEFFMLYYVLATSLYVMGTIGFTMIPSLKGTWQEVLNVSGTTLDVLNTYGYTNRFGWAGFAGFRNTIDCTLSIVFLTYLYSEKGKELNIRTTLFIFISALCFLGNMFYGRIGMVASAICIVLGLLLYRKIDIRTVVAGVSIVLVGVYFLSILRTQMIVVDDWLTWATKPFYNLFTTGSFNNYSANRLLNEMIFMLLCFFSEKNEAFTTKIFIALNTIITNIFAMFLADIFIQFSFFCVNYFI